MGSETTAAAFGAVGKVRRDPYAMLPFMGYHIGDYINHWINMGGSLSKAPLIFAVNWFRKDENGNFMWPGFGQNMRVLQWIVKRCRGEVGAVESPVGWMPEFKNIDWNGVEDFNLESFKKLMEVDPEMWKQDLLSHEELFATFYEKLPKEIELIREMTLASISRLNDTWEISKS